MSDVPARNGNGAAVWTRVAAAVAGIVAVWVLVTSRDALHAEQLANVKERADVDSLHARSLVEASERHVAEILALRDRVHEAVQGEVKAMVKGQDEVLQREMRLLIDALSQRVDRNRADIDTIQAFISSHLRLQADTLNGDK